jgi:hypothetical protein
MSNNRMFSIPVDEKSGKLSLKSGEVQLKFEKSIYFGMK